VVSGGFPAIHEAKLLYWEQAAMAECVNTLARNRGVRQLSARED
jgi:hypothetical protein